LCYFSSYLLPILYHESVELKKSFYILLVLACIIISQACAPSTQYDYCIEYCIKANECINSFNITDCENGCLRLKEDNPFPKEMSRTEMVLHPQLRICSEQYECSRFISCVTAYENGEEWVDTPVETEPVTP